MQWQGTQQCPRESKWFNHMAAYLITQRNILLQVLLSSCAMWNNRSQRFIQQLLQWIYEVYTLHFPLYSRPLFFPLIGHQQNRHDWICFLAFPLLIYVRLLWGYTRWWEMWEKFCASLFQDSTSINGTNIVKYLPTGTN